VQEDAGEDDPLVNLLEVGFDRFAVQVELLQRQFDGLLHLVGDAQLLFERYLETVLENGHGELCERLGHYEQFERTLLLVLVLHDFLHVPLQGRQLLLLEVAVVDVDAALLLALHEVQDGGTHARLVRLLDLAQTDFE